MVYCRNYVAKQRRKDQDGQLAEPDLADQ